MREALRHITAKIERRLPPRFGRVFAGGQGRQFIGRFIRILRGALLGQAIALALTPILSRLYSPAEFGVLAFYQNVFGILAVGVSLRLELAVPRARTATEATRIAFTGIACSMVIALILLPISAIWSFMDPSIDRSVSSYWYFLPLGAGMLGIYGCVSAWAAYYRAYGALGRTRLAQSLYASGIQLAWPLVSPGPFGLILASVVGQAGAATALGRLFVRRVRRLSKPGLLSTLIRLKSFALFATPASLVARAAVHLPVPIFLALYGPEMAGLIFFGQRLLSIPTLILGRSAAVPVQQAIGASSHGRGDPRLALIITTTSFGSLGLLFVAPIAVMGPSLFAGLLGEQWRQAGEYARLMAPMLLFQVIAAPFAQTLAVTGRHGIQLLVECSRLALLLVAILVPHYLGVSPELVVLSYSLATTFIYAGYVFAAFRLTSSARKSI